MFTTHTGNPLMSGPARTLGASMALVALCGVSSPTWAMKGASGGTGERVIFLGVATKRGLVRNNRVPAPRFHLIAERAMHVAEQGRDSFLGKSTSASGAPDRLLAQTLGAATEFAKQHLSVNHAARSAIKTGDERLRGQPDTVRGADDKEARRQIRLSGPGAREVLVTHELPGDLSSIITFELRRGGGVEPRPSQVAKGAPPSEALLIPKRLLAKPQSAGLEDFDVVAKANDSLQHEVDSWIVVRTPVQKGNGAEPGLNALFDQRTVEITVNDVVRGKQTYVFGVAPPEDSAD